jgi:four helix bundle protein
MHSTQSFRDLQVWQRAMDLVEDVYVTTKAFPGDERFGLTAQVRRAAVSIASNIGEGKRRKKRGPLLNHLDIALGSQGEVEVQLEIAQRVGFLALRDYRRLASRAEEVGRMLNGLIAALEARP